MEMHDLLDILHESFREYRYWPMKALRQKTKQPEAYLREVMEKIGVLVRSGPFSNNWTLQNEIMLADSKNAVGEIKEEEEDDDEDMEMEDVPNPAPGA